MSFQNFVRHTPFTFGLIVAFLGYFGLQFISGVNIDHPSNNDLVRFGADVLPLSMTKESWRLIVSGFLHIGLMHLVFNSFAMYFFGQATEKLLGAWQFLSVFLLSVIAGNLLSNYKVWQSVLAGGKISIGAGASGGIMGLGACLLVLSFMPRFAHFLDKKSLASVLAINLMMGFAIQGINNAAHIGGAICGAILGLLLGYTPIYKNHALSLVVCLSAFGTLLGAWWWLHKAVLAMM